MQYLFISTTSSAATLFVAALPKVQSKEQIFVLPLDGNGRALGKCCQCDNVASCQFQFPMDGMPGDDAKLETGNIQQGNIR